MVLLSSDIYFHDLCSHQLKRISLFDKLPLVVSPTCDIHIMNHNCVVSFLVFPKFPLPFFSIIFLRPKPQSFFHLIISNQTPIEY